MKIEKLSKNPILSPGVPVTVKHMGNITEIRYMTKNVGGNIQKLDKETYINTITGEVKEFAHSENRADNKAGISRSLRNLRDVLNTNVTEPQNCRWITLTYKENMHDPARLYADFKRYNTRLRRYLKKSDLPRYEYISVAEPQGRGAWHLHIVTIFKEKAPFIPNSTLNAIWGLGFVKIQSLQDVDNIGVYLTAYLGDIELSDAFGSFSISGAEIIETKNGSKKRVAKGARLRLYPVGFRLYRCSRGIKQPDITECTEAEAMMEVEGARLTYETALRLSSDGETLTDIYYRHYNIRPNTKRDDTHE